MNRMERLTAILLLLQDKPRTSDDIAGRFEVSKRTVLRDMQALSEMGMPIIARDGARGVTLFPATLSLRHSRLLGMKPFC
ncbi:MAG: helix-turn-helix transcriptional regulator [Blastocatellia bacterium]